MGELNTMSINFLDPEKCRFYINPNGFTALKTEDKDYRRVRLLRTLPLHRPFEYISVSDMNKNEIGIIRNAADFPLESREIIEKDLAARYYCPQISEIYSIDEKMGSFYFDVSIDGFKKTFGVKDISRNIKMLDSGAVKMIEDGVLENPKVDAMFGQHIWPYYPVGKVAIRDGAMMASSDRFHITIRGKASHGSAPESGIDAIAAAAQVISALQTIVSRRVSPLDSAVVTIGTIHGGARYNVIADTVKLEGTCRNLNPEVRNKMEERIRAIVEGVCGGMGASGELEYFRGYSPTVNSHELFPFALETIREVVGEENAVIPESSALGGEDFSFYCERVPSIFFWTGILSPGAEVYPLHNGGLNPDEKALPIAIEVMTRCALKFLAGKK